MDRLAGRGLKINTEKSKFMETLIKFLGFTINGKTINIDKEIFGKLNEEILVKTKKQCQRVIGFLGYFKRFIHNFTGKSKSVFDAIKGKKEIETEGVSEILPQGYFYKQI